MRAGTLVGGGTATCGPPIKPGSGASFSALPRKQVGSREREFEPAPVDGAGVDFVLLPEGLGSEEQRGVEAEGDADNPAVVQVKGEHGFGKPHRLHFQRGRRACL